MKSLRLFTIVLFLFFSGNLWAQVIEVDAGYGTLNDAIAQNGGNKTYKLQAGQWYGLNASIPVTEPITIIGETLTGEQMPAIIQTGFTPDGTTFGWMFEVTANITIKNVFLVNADLNNSRGAFTFLQLGKARITIDSVTADPVGVAGLVAYNTDSASTYITNCLLMQHGQPTSLFDGFMWQYNGVIGLDTLYVENNTFVDIGLNFYLANNDFQRGGKGLDNFLWFNHNTILFGKSDLMNVYYTNSLFFTNNLLWHYGFHPYTNSPSIWFYNYGDIGPGNTVASLVKADTMKVDSVNHEALPSQRKCFVEYNYNYRDPKIEEIIQLGLDSGFVSYLLHLIPPAEMADSSREARIFADDANFPNFKAGNNIEDQPNTNPMFNDQMIYQLTDSAIVWAKYSAQNFWGFSPGSYPSPENWPYYYYQKDAELGNPTTWPRFDGSYTNSQLLSASIEKLPLGDLNWFPDKKAIWEANKDDVMEHILNLNESQIDVTSIRRDNHQIPNKFDLSQNYPNPFNPSTEIKYSITKQGKVSLEVYNLLGQKVATIVNETQNPGNYTINFDASKLASGVYVYRIQSDNRSLAKKMVLIK